ncbi:glycosyltransferase family 2 protein [Gemmatimonas sp.]|uniref:glycosyltransferase family 2 protein n=1 Tax=Gemmatimonas sp. TaxID=1962908 RepID=UPI003564E77D
MDVTVIVATFGDQSWQEIAFAHAIPSAETQAPTVSFHAPAEVLSLGDCRNRAIDFHDPKGWLCFLDADDQLAPGYLAFMEQAYSGDETELLIPAVQYLVGATKRGAAKTFSDRDIDVMNPCPIGTLIHRDVFEDVGRFWDESAWEDWSLFRRATLAGSKLKFVAEAVYRAQLNRNGRNSTVRDPKRLHASIITSHDRWLKDRA